MPKDCTVIIPAYNAEKTIIDSLNSLQLENLWEHSLEVLVVNDGSADNTADVVRKYIENVSESVKLINKSNGGVSSARNEGLKQATGKYVYFLDSDDLCHRDVLEEMINVGEENSAGCVLSNYVILDTKDSFVKIVENDLFDYDVVLDRHRIEQIVLRGYFEGGHGILPSLSNKIYRLDYIKGYDINFDPQRTHGEDWAFNILYFSKVNSCVAIPSALYVYRINGTQGYGKYSVNLRYSLCNGYDIGQHLRTEYNLCDKFSKMNYSFQVRFLRQILAYLDLVECTEKEKRKMVKSIQVKESLRELLSLKLSEYSELGISRRSKLGFLLLYMGMYRIAQAFIVV